MAPTDIGHLLVHFNNLAGYGETAETPHDLSGNDNHAVSDDDPCPELTAAGRFGEAFRYQPTRCFDGADDSPLQLSERLSISGWFQPATFPSSRRFVVAKVNDPSEDANAFCVIC